MVFWYFKGDINRAPSKGDIDVEVDVDMDRNRIAIFQLCWFRGVVTKIVVNCPDELRNLECNVLAITW